MKAQLVFTEKYLDELKRNVRDGISIDSYKENQFPADLVRTRKMGGIEAPEDLLSQMDIKDDCATAIALFEAYKNIEPIEATDERFWAYLTHVDLFEYVQRRWPAIIENTTNSHKDYILQYWFLTTVSQSTLMRHSLARLWWGVYLSVDEARGSGKYDLTKVLFRQLDFATRTLGTYKLGRHKPAVIGILEFVEENPELFKNCFEAKSRFLAEHLNRVGGTKEISFFEKDFFKSELKKVTKQIEAIISRE